MVTHAYKWPGYTGLWKIPVAVRMRSPSLKDSRGSCKLGRGARESTNDRSGYRVDENRSGARRISVSICQTSSSRIAKSILRGLSSERFGTIILDDAARLCGCRFHAYSRTPVYPLFQKSFPPGTNITMVYKSFLRSLRIGLSTTYVAIAPRENVPGLRRCPT